MQDKKVRKRYPYLWAVLYSIFLTGYTIFTLLDAFVLPRDMLYLEDISSNISKDETASNHKDSEQSIEETQALEPMITDSSYESSDITITITTYREYDTEIYVADVILKEISYLRAGLAGGAFGRNVKETTSAIAEENNAILAINGDYYGFRDKGFVMRNGYFYRNTARSSEDDDALVIYENGHMEIISENDTNVQELVQNAVQIFSFGPGLIQKGNILVNQFSEVEKAMRSNPRTAIGEISPFHYILLVSDGRTEESEGLSLWELAQFMQELGCETAYNLDGGGSSVMWFMGKIVNHPTDGRRMKERSVSDIVYIGK